MEDARFERVSREGMDQLTALFGPLRSMLPGEAITYNAYLGGTEVVVVGYQYAHPEGYTATKPVAILVDDDLFRSLRVDHEAARTIDGQEAPAHVQ